jgi:CD2 antigen cytoplasmic tail-binding protein 2
VEEEVKLTPFNMVEELEEGDLTADGFYMVKKHDDLDKWHDAWLEGIDTKEMERARQNKARREEQERRQMQQESEEGTEEEKKARWMLELHGLMQDEERVMDTMKRLGGVKSTSKRKVPIDTVQKQQLDRVIELCDQLLGLGMVDIYTLTRRDLHTTPVVDATTLWEFHWIAQDASSVHGPYPMDTMVAWVRGNYFGPSGTSIRVRPAAANTAWQTVLESPLCTFL